MRRITVYAVHGRPVNHWAIAPAAQQTEVNLNESGLNYCVLSSGDGATHLAKALVIN